MTMVAYTRSSSRRILGERFKNLPRGGVLTAGQSMMPMAHIPQTGTRETMCGKPMYEQIDVPDDSDIKICKNCQSRLRSTVLRIPGCELVRSLLGNKLLPAADH